MCVILIFKAWRQYRKIEKWQKGQEAMWKLEKAREENAEERRKYEKEKGWEGWVELEVRGQRLEAGGSWGLGAGRLCEVEAVSRSVVGRAKAYSIKVNGEQSLLAGNDVG